MIAVLADIANQPSKRGAEETRMTTEHVECNPNTHPSAAKPFTTVVLAFEVKPEHVDKVLGILEVVREGIYSQDTTGGYYGPNAITEPCADRLLCAVLEEAEGWHEGDVKEPSIIADRAILAGAKAIVRSALDWPSDPNQIRAVEQTRRAQMIERLERSFGPIGQSEAPAE